MKAVLPRFASKPRGYVVMYVKEALHVALLVFIGARLQFIAANI